MNRIGAGLRTLVMLGAVSLTAACAYPSEPRYSIFADAAPAAGRRPIRQHLPPAACCLLPAA